MQLHPLKLVTIVAEEILKDPLRKKFLELGATGYTSSEAQGYGSRGSRTDEFGSGNVRFEIICPANVAEAILTFVAQTYVENYACISWMVDVQVARGARYVK